MHNTNEADHGSGGVWCALHAEGRLLARGLHSRTLAAACTIRRPVLYHSQC